MFPGRKLDDQGKEAGDGQLFQPGPLDLDGGVIRVRRAAAVSEAAVSEEDTEGTRD
jgi:hypothetical protein